MSQKVIIGTRESRLAVIQSQIVKDYIEKNHKEIQVELLPMKTSGDKILDRTLDQVGGKGLFVKELDQALLDGRSQLSVHSLKDMPMEVAEELPLLAFSEREDPRDVLVLPEGRKELDLSLPIGCSGPRRVLQLKALFPGCQIKAIRGNVLSRLKKLDEGQYGALVLAAAGLKRLGLEKRIHRYFEPQEMIPAAGQGILAVQGRRGEDYSYLEGFQSEESALAAQGERSFVKTLDGGCSSPIAAYGRVEDGKFTLIGLYYDEKSGDYRKGEKTGRAEDAEKIGRELAFELRSALQEKQKERRQPDSPKGKVWLVGAGPGDPGLMTRKGMELLEEAEVVVYDSLVSSAILSFIPQKAEAINVGKRASHHTMEQQEINRLLADKAGQGKRVVRLKGGDPFLFGRGGEELELLRTENIPYEVVPGITAALAVPAYNGIPVTHRDYCSSVHIITGHKQAGRQYDIDFRALVQAGGTLVFLMGVSALGQICQSLIEAGMEKDMPAALLQKGTTAEQERIIATVSTLEEEVKKKGAVTPAIILVGKVCALGENLSWWEKLPLAGSRILSVRPKNRPSFMTKRLQDLGAEVIEIPSIATSPLQEQNLLHKALHQLEQYQWLAFTSPYGVEVFFEEMKKEGLDIRKLGNIKIAVLGSATERAVRERGLLVDLRPKVFDGENLGKALAAVCDQGDRILLARAEAGSAEIIREIRKREGIFADDVPIYQTAYQKQNIVDLTALFQEGKIDCVAFTSASTVDGLAKAAPEIDFTKVKAACIGKQTAARAARYGMKVFIAKEASMESLTQLICQLQNQSEIGERS